MAKITRKNQKILGANSANNGQFGSAQIGTFVINNDPDVIQGLSAWEGGWNDATFSSAKLPAIEEMQGVDYVVTRQLAYLFQEGIPEWNAETEYFQYSLVKETGTVKIYKSLVDDNIGHALSNNTYWKLVCDFNTVQPKDNYSAIIPPTVNDDASHGYSNGSKWYDAVGNEAYLCVNPANGAAIWIKITLTVDELGSLAFKNTVADTDINVMTSAQFAGRISDETGIGSLVFATSPTLITPTLGVAAATSINFGQTALSYYGEGTFTPTLYGATTAGTTTYTTQTGRYTRIGNRIWYDIRVAWSNATGTGPAYIGGLPFTANSTILRPAITVSYYHSLSLPAGSILAGWVEPAQSYVRLVNTSNTTYNSSTDLQTQMTTDGELWFSGSYQV